MSTGYGWEGLRQVCATLLGARHDCAWAPLWWLNFSLLGAL